MILTYHKVNIFPQQDSLTVGLVSFFVKMLSFANKKVVYLDDYNPDDRKQIVINFDDGYIEVLKYALPVLSFFSYPFELFLVGDFYDAAEKSNKDYCNKNDLTRIIKNGGRLQYHSKTHPHLDTIYDSYELDKEIMPPEYLKALDPKGFNFFAYPFWTYNDKVIGVVRKYFKGARSGNGFADNTIYAMDSIRQERYKCVDKYRENYQRLCK